MILDLLDQEKIEEKEKNILQEAMTTKEQVLLALMENSLAQELDTSHLSLTLELLEKTETEVLEVHSAEKESLTPLENEVTGFLRENEVLDERENHILLEKVDLLENQTDSAKRNLLPLENEVTGFLRENEVLDERENHILLEKVDLLRKIPLISLKNHTRLRVLISAEEEISLTKVLTLSQRKILIRNLLSKRMTISEIKNQPAKLQ
jgi:hypothetical protein